MLCFFFFFTPRYGTDYIIECFWISSNKVHILMVLGMALQGTYSCWRRNYKPLNPGRWICLFAWSCRGNKWNMHLLFSLTNTVTARFGNHLPDSSRLTNSLHQPRFYDFILNILSHFCFLFLWVLESAVKVDATQFVRWNGEVGHGNKFFLRNTVVRDAVVHIVYQVCVHSKIFFPLFSQAVIKNKYLSSLIHNSKQTHALKRREVICI